MSNLATTIVVTTIFKPNHAVAALRDLARLHSAEFVVAGDKKTPEGVYEAYDCTYLSPAEQENLFPAFARLLPFNHYGRKNVGYLHAMKSGARRIVETDDDNIPGEHYLSRTKSSLDVEMLAGHGWHNVYADYSKSRIWPRGYPIETLNDDATPVVRSRAHVSCPIQQGLADGNPDVDAIYRMIGKLPVVFDKRGDVALGSGLWCPFNSQNTTWFEEAFLLLYLPSFCSFRMTDIWRSFIAQRILWENASNLVFHEATVRQERNDHPLIGDFEHEVPGYLNNDRIRKTLEDLNLKNGWHNAGDNLVRCYDSLINLGVVGSREKALVAAWVGEVENA